MPARHIPPKHRSLSGHVATAKTIGSQAFESSLERDFLLMLEYDRGISRFASQPITLRWRENGRVRQYTPDILAEYTSNMMESHPYLKPTLFEIKPEAILKRDWKVLKPKFKEAIHWCRKSGCRFRIITERHIRTPYLKNIKFLLQFGEDRFRFDEDYRQTYPKSKLRAKLFELGRTTPQELLEAISHNQAEQARLLPYLWHLVRMGLIGADLQDPLSMTSTIWTSEKGCNLVELLGGPYSSRIEELLKPNT